MTRYLFLFTIGPVQTFIAQARKTRDLFVGSYILSKLIRKAIEKLNNEKILTELIFPSLNVHSISDNQPVPNRFIAVLETDNIKKVGQELSQFVKDIYIKKSMEIIEKYGLPRNNVPDFYKDAEEQLKNFLHINWVSLPFFQNQYRQIYGEIEQLLGGIKNIRIFKQLDELSGRKCSICGERNALLYKGNPDRFHKNAFPLKGNISINLTEGEGLCSICFVKRSYESKKQERFPSTAKIALMDTLNKLDETGETLVNEYKGEFHFLFDEFDEQLFYEENITKKYFRKNYIPEKSIEVIAKKQKDLGKYIKHNGLKLCKYYAIVMLDGDNMGKWLSGENLCNYNKEDINLYEFHKEMSSRLIQYGNEMKNIFIEPSGKLVYAGGDDLLGFINLNHLPTVLKNIREKFPDFEEIKIDNKKIIKDGIPSTASCGVVIAHYKTPLSDVLNWVRRMEKEEAKKVDGKNSCAIAVLKHSGEIVKTIFKWKYCSDNKTTWTTDLMDNLIKMLSRDIISSNFITTLNREFLPLMEQDGSYKEGIIVEKELERLLKRSYEHSKKEDKEFEKLLMNLKAFYSPPITLRNFLSFLNIIRFIAREVHYAD